MVNQRTAFALCVVMSTLAPVVTMAAAPPPPSNVTATPSDGAVQIDWKESPGATLYNAYWSTSPAPIRTATYENVDVKRGDTIGGLTNGTHYFIGTAASGSEERAPSPPAVVGTPTTPSNGAAQLEQCKHSGSRTDEKTPYACVWMMGDGYAQILNTGDTSTSFGLGVQYVAFERPIELVNGARRMDDFQEGSIFFKKGAIATIEGSDPASFASMVLDPQSASFSFDASFRHETRMACKSDRRLLRWFCAQLTSSDLLAGAAAYASAGSAKWAFTPTGATSGATPATFNVYAYGVGPSFRFLPDWMEKNFVTVTAAVYFTQRIVQGDPGMRHLVFGTTVAGANDHTFTGVEPQLTLQINTVTVTASVPILNGSADRVSHGQFFMSVGLRTGALLN